MSVLTTVIHADHTSIGVRISSHTSTSDHRRSAGWRWHRSSNSSSPMHVNTNLPPRQTNREPDCARGQLTSVAEVVPQNCPRRSKQRRRVSANGGDPRETKLLVSGQVRTRVNTPREAGGTATTACTRGISDGTLNQRNAPRPGQCSTSRARCGIYHPARRKRRDNDVGPKSRRPKRNPGEKRWTSHTMNLTQCRRFPTSASRSGQSWARMPGD